MKTPQRTLLPEALELNKRWESLRLYAYPDPGSPLYKAASAADRRRWGHVPARVIIETLPKEQQELDGAPWTCGFGHTRGVDRHTRCTEAQAEVWLDEDFDSAQNDVERLVKVELNDYQYGALVVLVFNIGGTNFASSTLLKKLNKGLYDEAGNHFLDWVKIKNRDTGKLEFSQGLKNRRVVEQAFFLRGSYVASKSDLVEATPTKTIMTDGRTVAPGLTSLAAVGAGASEAAEKVSMFVGYSEILKTVFIALTIIGVLVSLYYGVQARKKDDQ